MDLDPALTSAGGFAALGAVFVAVNTIIIPLRFYARRQQGSAYQADDWTIIPAYVCDSRDTGHSLSLDIRIANFKSLGIFRCSSCVYLLWYGVDCCGLL